MFFTFRPISNLVIQWFKVVNGTKTLINPSNNFFFSAITPRTLNIRDPLFTHSGEYRCEAKMPGDPTPVAASAFLTVHGRPTLYFVVFLPYTHFRPFVRIHLKCKLTRTYSFVKIQSPNCAVTPC